jgi:hypothetical protein
MLYQLYAMHARNEGQGAIEQRKKLDSKVEEKHAMCAKANLLVARIEDGMSEQKREHNKVYTKQCKTKET